MALAADGKAKVLEKKVLIVGWVLLQSARVEVETVHYRVYVTGKEFHR